MQHDYARSPVAQDYGDVIGTPFKVFLSNGVTETCDKITGKVMTEIIDLPGLVARILQSRVLHPRKLSGDDLKFIRSALHMRSVEIADVLDVSPEHYSRCEGGTKTLSASSEKSYRMYVYLQAALKDMDVQKIIAKNKSKKRVEECDPKQAKETVDAFKQIFLEMKIQHIFDPKDELEFSFFRGPPRDGKQIADGGKDDGKWQEPDKQAA